MGDFFYHGQKDTIQRLNELAGRGAVVASYTPKVGMSPVGGANGKMTPDWLDPDIPIASAKPLTTGSTAKYGYNYRNIAGQRRWVHIATIPQDDAWNWHNLLIKGVVNDSWTAYLTSAISVLLAVRNGFFVEWHLEGRPRVGARIIVYKLPSDEFGVYLFLDGYATASFDITGTGSATFASPEETSEPAGSIVFDTAATPGQTGYFAPKWRTYTYNGVGIAGTLFNGGVYAGDANSPTISWLLSANQNETAPGIGKEVLRLGVGGIDNYVHAGQFQFSTSGYSANASDRSGYKLSIKAFDIGSGSQSGELLTVNGNGKIYALRLAAGYVTPTVTWHEIGIAGAVQNADILTVVNSVGFRACDGGYGNTANAAMIVCANSVTGRSSNNRGTVNTMGNDYAEYVFKASGCGVVAPGQVVGITADNKITDSWTEAGMFSIKSTAPSFVGGDSWALDLGDRPSSKAGQPPTQPVRRDATIERRVIPATDPVEYADVLIESGDTDAEWAAKQAAYAAALAAHGAAMQQDAEAMAAFDAALETERQKVDRIAIAGRVPVNVLGARPGDYIVPVQDGAGIKGIAVREDDLTMKQYLHAVGRVISIEPDGRAYVMVKAV